MSVTTLSKEQIYPCMAASQEKLDEMLQGIYGGRSSIEFDLKSYTHPENPDNIHWDEFRHLRMVGDAEANNLKRFQEAGIPRGFHLSADGSWLLIILPEAAQPEDYLLHCGTHLESLAIMNTPIFTWDWRKTSGLKELYFEDLPLLDTLAQIDSLTVLERLLIRKCPKLTKIQGLDRLANLTLLYIAVCENLTALPSLENLSQLTDLNLYGCTSLTSLPGLENLSQLTDLNLSRCEKLTALPGLENLSQLTKLNLSRCEKLTALPDLESLSQLTNLNLSWCENLTALPGLENLTQLTHLDLYRCENLTALPGLENLTQLTKLNLSGCRKLTTLPGLENLTQLADLNLSGCEKLTALPGLENLSQLTELNLSRCENLTALPGLEKLSQLTDLNLYGCMNLTALPGLENLTQLADLNLSGCEKLTALPGLENLSQLTELNLSRCENFTALPGLEKLSQLTDLSLSRCEKLTTLTDLEKLSQLTDLHLRGCVGLTSLPEGIRQLSSLRRLDLRDLRLQELPDWLPEIAEVFSFRNPARNSRSEKAIVYLSGTAVDTIPDMSIFDQPYEMVVEWFKNRRLGQIRPLNEIKVVFLGDGEAGKSHTIARLLNDGGEPNKETFDGESTPGIVISNKDYDLDGRKIRVHYWDFGGQEIMHSMHRIFLTGRTMYVILLNARDDTQSDRAKYWLHNVKSFAPDAPVLLVLNKIDQNENASVDEPDLRGKYDKLTQVVRLSALKDSQEDFNNRFTNVLLEEIQKTGFLDAQWPTAWTRVKDMLEHMETHYITGGDYQAICADCQVDDNQKNLLHWFNDLGVSFCYEDNDDEYYALEDYVILRPDWITNALYIILFNLLEGAQNGLIPHRSIYNLLRNAHNTPKIRCTLPEARYSGGDIGYVLGIMRKFNLSFTDGHGHEFIPMLCQQNSLVDVPYYQKDADTLEFSMEFDYLPPNLLHRLMVERRDELDMSKVWRTGASFRNRELGYNAVVVIDSNTLRFFIRHTDPMHRPNTYLTMLKAHVDRIVAKMGLQSPTCQLIYKLDGKRDEFDYEDVKLNRELGDTTMTSKAHRKKILIEDILNQSAPDTLDDEKKLLDAIRQSCIKIQAEPDYFLKQGETGRGMEDKRNRRIRDDLELLGYWVKDQTQRGLSGTGRGIGELDLLVCNDKKEPWTIIEALRVSSGARTEWDKHLDKLVANYNYFGAPCLYLLTYVDADVSDFQRIWESYQRHIPNHNPGKFRYSSYSLVDLNDAGSPQYVKVAKCKYTCEGQATTVYHIFAQIPTRNE